jgi:hypothetical protein
MVVVVVARLMVVTGCIRVIALGLAAAAALRMTLQVVIAALPAYMGLAALEAGEADMFLLPLHAMALQSVVVVPV